MCAPDSHHSWSYRWFGILGAAEWLGLCPKGAANAVRNPADGRSVGLLLSGDALIEICGSVYIPSLKIYIPSLKIRWPTRGVTPSEVESRCLAAGHRTLPTLPTSNRESPRPPLPIFCQPEKGNPVLRIN